MTAKVYTASSATTSLFAEKNGEWYSIKFRTVTRLAARPACPLEPVDLSLFPLLRARAASI